MYYIISYMRHFLNSDYYEKSWEFVNSNYYKETRDCHSDDQYALVQNRKNKYDELISLADRDKYFRDKQQMFYDGISWGYSCSTCNGNTSKCICAMLRFVQNTSDEEVIEY